MMTAAKKKILCIEDDRETARIAPRFGSMPFVFLTALTDRNNELKGRRLGADDYVTKPIDFDVPVVIINARVAHIARTDVWAKDVQLNRTARACKRSR